GLTPLAAEVKHRWQKGKQGIQCRVIKLKFAAYQARSRLAPSIERPFRGETDESFERLGCRSGTVRDDVTAAMGEDHQVAAAHHPDGPLAPQPDAHVSSLDDVKVSVLAGRQFQTPRPFQLVVPVDPAIASNGRHHVR